MSRFLLIGPPQIGKSAAANRIADALGCKSIIYSWDGIDSLPSSVLAIVSHHDPHYIDYDNENLIKFKVNSAEGLQALVEALERKPVTSKKSDTARVLTCVYCGHEYPQDTPASGNQVLTDHIKVCEQYPMRQFKADNTKLRNALAGLVGADTKELLDNMETATRLFTQIPEEDRINSINAICALRDTLGRK